MGPGQLILQVPGELGAAGVERLRMALDCGVGAQCEVILDLSGLRLLDAAGVRFLMSVRDRNGIRLRGTRDGPLLVFLLLRLDGRGGRRT